MKLLTALLCFGIIAGRGATTDGYVYLGHNEDQWGEQMLNIYNVPAGKDRCAYLWFEFPGQRGAWCTRYVRRLSGKPAAHARQCT